ncbi:MAG TPA: nucleoside deaminase [Firmicutes bacterium]|jgi:tRNA(adenine34) deaminase|nr:nucleoside deaminase [Bacillota bacterium]
MEHSQAQLEEHERFMRAALEEAMVAQELGEVPIGAVVTYDGKVIGAGHNMRETWRDPTAHAEVIAIRQAARRLNSWRLTGSRLYVTIEPCAMCAGALVLSRIDHLIFGAADSKAGAVCSLYNITADARLNHQLVVTGGILKQECGELMQQFFRRLRRRPGYNKKAGIPEGES